MLEWGNINKTLMCDNFKATRPLPKKLVWKFFYETHVPIYERTRQNYIFYKT